MSVRLRRLYAEYERLKVLFADHERIRIVEALGDPPTGTSSNTESRPGGQQGSDRGLLCAPHRYHAWPQLPERDGVVCGDNSNLPSEYRLSGGVHRRQRRRQPPRSKITSFSFGRLITFQDYNLQSPRNGDAAKWTAANLDRLPLERVNLWPHKTLEGAAVPALRPEQISERPRVPQPAQQPRSSRRSNPGARIAGATITGPVCTNVPATTSSAATAPWTARIAGKCCARSARCRSVPNGRREFAPTARLRAPSAAAPSVLRMRVNALYAVRFAAMAVPPCVPVAVTGSVGITWMAAGGARHAPSA